MDGGSTDGSVDVLRSYGDRIDWTSGPDGGQADAINCGIERVGGDIVAFLNADDAYEPGAVATAVERFRDRPGAAMVWGTARVLDADDRHVLTTAMEPTDHLGLARANPIHQPAAFVSGHAWREVGGLDEQLELALDYDLWIRLSDGVQIAAVPDVLARVRFHPAAKTESQRGRHFREAMRVVRRHYGHVPATWTGVYARWLAAGRPSAVAELPRSRRSTALQLPIGLYANPHAPLRTVREWVADSGIGRFEGRWHDGWISRRWRTSLTVPASADRVRIKGMHHAMRRRPLGLRASLDGERVASIDLREPGEFVLESALDPALRGRESVLTVQASYTFRVPTDARRLSCQIAEVSFE
jgi:glycosyltransferase involved in cell wall biosynthesis